MFRFGEREMITFQVSPGGLSGDGAGAGGVVVNFKFPSRIGVWGGRLYAVDRS